MARLLRDQGYTATGRAQLLAVSGVSNGSLYHHFPGGMEQLAEAALDASGQAVGAALSDALSGAPNTAAGVGRFLELAARPDGSDACPGCPIAPTALESPLISSRLRAAAARCFEQWEGTIAGRLRADGWPENTATDLASALLSLIEGALLLGRVSGDADHLRRAKNAVASLLAHHEATARPTARQ